MKKILKVVLIVFVVNFTGCAGLGFSTSEGSFHINNDGSLRVSYPGTIITIPTKLRGFEKNEY